MKSDIDIFSVLAKYNSTEEEDYLTEAFVFLLKNLLVRERTFGLEILNRLCTQDNDFSFQSGEPIAVSTQEPILKGKDTPDITIISPTKKIYVEVKDYAAVDPEQLRKYRGDLDSCRLPFKRLILLTRFPIDQSKHKGLPDKQVRWCEVHNWLASLKPREAVSEYLVNSFKSFLEAKGMSIQQVGSEYIKGIPALNNMMSMIEKAIEESGMHFYKSYPRAAGWGFKGFWMEDKQFWCGIYYHNPLVVTFQLVDKRKFNKELIGTTDYKLKEGNVRLWFRLPLEEINFFSLGKDKQLEEITKFVKTAYAEAQQMMVK